MGANAIASWTTIGDRFSHWEYVGTRIIDGIGRHGAGSINRRSSSGPVFNKARQPLKERAGREPASLPHKVGAMVDVSTALLLPCEKKKLLGKS